MVVLKVTWCGIRFYVDWAAKFAIPLLMAAAALLLCLATRAQVRKTPSRPRSWANFSIF
jgi:hypothetical protein